jgi:hypothetical protein
MALELLLEQALDWAIDFPMAATFLAMRKANQVLKHAEVH